MSDSHDRGARAPSRFFVFDTFVENRVEWTATLVFARATRLARALPVDAYRKSLMLTGPIRPDVVLPR